VWDLGSRKKGSGFNLTGVQVENLVGPLPLNLTLGSSQQRVCWDCSSASLKTTNKNPCGNNNNIYKIKTTTTTFMLGGGPCQSLDFLFSLASFYEIE
jgi:hypothetical protein